ncbi:Protein tyrosine phosphatase domain-containing protein 1 [Phytophthora pseudosyringae]|uniref:Protein tyrosine phosphatase domain-containing protein 1 n=1 Tax=Phytophthora pseudosyringae TaxID=221518 RepID=A0A8T1W0P7_9STRA|nr:Protein tyrosine phosphatase domain-containing protein 1 [Phytophthora pseudosyringae]
MGSPVKAREWEKTLKVKCRLCGGARCKRCSESAALAKQDSPVKGLHADWVADCALAMMRPSSRLMNEYKIAEQFHKLNITAVFNLTLPGEHPYCGDGLGASGFPYDPERDLMAENSARSSRLRFYNFGWEDMTTPTLSFMMDIVKVVASVLLTGHHRVAVHCHAGYGRTGITIACALIFLHNIPPELAIRLVRRDRPGSVQTAGQVQFVHDFHAYLNAARVVFALPKIHDRFTLAETVEHQNRRLHGEGAVNSSLPRVLDFLCAEVEGAVAASSDVVTVASAFVNHLSVRQQDAWPRTSECTKEFYPSTSLETAELLELHRQFISGAVGESLTESNSIPFDAIEAPEPVTREQLFPIKIGFNVGDWNWEEASALCPNASTHAILLLDWLEHLREPLLSSQLVEKLLYVAPVPPLKLPSSSKTTTPAATLQHARSESERHPSSNNTIVSSYQFHGLHQLPAYAMRSLDRVLSCLRVLEAKLEHFDTGDVLFNAICARTAMALFHLTSTSCSASSLRRHADCVALLVDKWHAPKRLELNLESLQKLSIHRPSSCRLTQSASTIGYNPESGDNALSHDNNLPKPHAHSRSPTRSALSPTSSPTRTPREPASPTNNLPGTLSEDMADSPLQLQTTPGTDQLGASQLQQPHKPQGEAHARPNAMSSVAIATTSPRSSPRSTSPLKIDPLPTSFNRREEQDKAENKLPVSALPSTPSSSPKKIDLSPLSPQPIPDKEFELSDDNFGFTISAEHTSSTLPLNSPALPSVRDGGRYSRRAGK